MTPPPPASASQRPGAALVLAISGVASVAVALLVLAAGGGLSAAAYGPFDPGTLTRIGIPVLRPLRDLAAAVAVGATALAAWGIAPATTAERGAITGARQAARRVALVAAASWLGLAVVLLGLTAAEVSGIPPGAPGFGAVVTSFTSQIDLGRALGVSALLVAICVTLLVTATRHSTLVWAAAVALLALPPLALAGHAGSARDHANAVDTMTFHLLGVTLWVGGLITVLAIRRTLGRQLPAVVQRYSRLAGWCFVAVAASGLIAGWLRVGSLEGLGSRYGLLVAAKGTALLALGVAGWVHRRQTLRALPERPVLFIRLAAAEIVVMGATVGLAVGLSRTPPPSAAVPVDPLDVLLGFPAPPPLTAQRYLTEFYPSVLWLTVAIGLAALYLVGVVRLRRRSVAWPVGRSIAWVAGCAALVMVTSGGIGVYGMLHFSTHMVQHMALMIVVPLLLVLGAPVTLAMRALKPRTDGSFGAREQLLALVHSRPLQILGNPVVAAALFTVGLVIFYYSRLFEVSMFTHTGHVLMTAHFLAAGYLFVWALVGVDPGPRRPPYAFRMIVLMITLAFHAFFGISLMSSNDVLALDWWHSLGQLDDAALLADQQNGGAIAWATGDVPSLLLAVLLAVGWVRSDTRRARQLDRQADRDNDAELRAYNERLTALHRRDERQ